MAKEQKRIIDAEEIRLIDNRGRVRLMLGTHERSGAPYVSLRDEQQLERLVVSLRDNGSPIISFLHPDGPTLLGMEAKAEGEAGLEIRRRDGTLAVAIGIDINHDCRIEVCDSDGEIQWTSDG